MCVHLENWPNLWKRTDHRVCPWKPSSILRFPLSTVITNEGIWKGIIRDIYRLTIENPFCHNHLQLFLKIISRNQYTVHTSIFILTSITSISFFTSVYYLNKNLWDISSYHYDSINTYLYSKGRKRHEGRTNNQLFKHASFLTRYLQCTDTYHVWRENSQKKINAKPIILNDELNVQLHHLHRFYLQNSLLLHFLLTVLFVLVMSKLVQDV